MRADRQFLSSMRFDGVPAALADRRHRTFRMVLAAGLAALTVVVVAATVMNAL